MAGALTTGLLALPSGASAGLISSVISGSTQTTTSTTKAVVQAAPGGTCTPMPTSKVFAKVDGDQADYSVAPGGDFESPTSSWTLAGGAKIVSGNETLSATPGTRSLALPVGGIAISPRFCVDETNPHFRFAFKVNGLGKGFIAKIIYDRADGPTTTQLVSSKDISVAPSTWQASPVSPLATILPLKGGSATVQIQLIGATFTGATLLSLPAVNIDSVMVDPFRRS